MAGEIESRVGSLPKRHVGWLRDDLRTEAFRLQEMRVDVVDVDEDVLIKVLCVRRPAATRP